MNPSQIKCKEKRKLPLKIKASYAIGQMADSISFNLFYFFYMYFLTDFAGIPAGAAGTISLIAIIWDAVSDPVVGHISDGLASKWGRRRPLMIGSLLPYVVTVFLLFHNVDLDGTAKTVYFGVITILFWTCYKFYVIPYFALGAEIADDFNERTSVRAWAGVFVYIAVLAASAAPPAILEYTFLKGGSDNQAWNYVGLIFAAITAIAILICWRYTRGGEMIPNKSTEKEKTSASEKNNLIHNFSDILKLKSARILMATVLLGSLVSSLTSSSMVYLMSNVLHYSGSLQSTVFTLMSVASILWIPFVNIAAKKFDKKIVYSLSLLFASAVSISFFFIGFASIAQVLIFIALFQVGMSAYWTLYYSMMYDLSELDEFKTGKRREGMISAVMSFSQKLGAAASMWMLGWILDFGGYNGAAQIQPDNAIDIILAVNTCIPGIFGILAATLAFAYPLTRKRFNLLIEALTLKREGKTYTTDGFEILL